jgi:hypothetical protein
VQVPSSSNKFYRVGAVIVLGIAMLVGPSAGGASAAMHNNCGFVNNYPWTNGVYAYTQTTITCSTYMAPTATMAQARVQESVLGVFKTRVTGTPKYASGDQTLTSYTAQYYCNGHGTDTYRNRATGHTSDGGNSTMNLASKSLSC